VTGGLTASVGVGTSKFIAKVASELAKPDGRRIVEPGTEVGLLAPMPVGVLPGVGPVTAEKLLRIGIRTVADLQGYAVDELAQTVGRAHAQGLVELAHARDERAVEPERETKSISVEDTFETDLTDPIEQRAVLHRQARQVADRLSVAGLFARTVSIKVRLPDFSTFTRSRTLSGVTDGAEAIGMVAAALLAGVDVTGGVRLLGIGVAGLTELRQQELFADEATADGPADVVERQLVNAGQLQRDWLPGVDVGHEEHGRGWVWGAGLGRVTVRFETRDTPPGPVRTFSADDPKLYRIDPVW
jgi:DNA polymerase IV